MSNLEIQREEIVEIVGTQYEGRQKNHANLKLQQKLIMKRQKDNIHDPNAILMLTEDGKELGFIPKGQASLYAPAMDSNKYRFDVEVIKTEHDPERPILIVRIIAEFKELSEDNVEKSISEFVQNLANGCYQRKSEYFSLLYASDVNATLLLSCFNKARLIHKLFAAAEECGLGKGIERNTSSYQPFGKQALKRYLQDIQLDISEILKKLQKAYNDTMDIDDEDEYMRIQSEIREKRKRFRMMSEFCESCCHVLEEYEPLRIHGEESTAKQTEPEVKPSVSRRTQQKQITTVQKAEFEQQQQVSTNTVERKLNNPHDPALPFSEQVVDLKNPQDCTYNKPTALVFNGSRYPVNSWRSVYKVLLKQLYSNEKNAIILQKMIGTALYGRRIDFTNHASSNVLIEKMQIAPDFYAEANLSAKDVIKRINALMERCSITADQLQILYSTQKQGDSVEQAQPQPEPVSTVSAVEPVREQNKPFVLKEAVITILSDTNPDTSERTQLTVKEIQVLLKNLYQKEVGLFELSKLLMTDNTFRAMGKGYYGLSHAQANDSETTKSAMKSEMHSVKTSSVSESTKPISNPNTISAKELTEAVLKVTRQNKDQLQYRDGFGVYEVKTLLAHEGITNVSEEAIETIMINCDALKEIEEGYYQYIGKSESSTASETSVTVSAANPEPKQIVVERDSYVEQPQNAAERHIVLKLDGNIVRAYDASDALNKICEFAIKCKPFKMARIAGQSVMVRGKQVFYRRAVPVDGYHMLSNGTQVMKITDITDLQEITEAVVWYCEINQSKIEILSK